MEVAVHTEPIVGAATLLGDSVPFVAALLLAACAVAAWWGCLTWSSPSPA